MTSGHVPFFNWRDQSVPGRRDVHDKRHTRKQWEDLLERRVSSKSIRPRQMKETGPNVKRPPATSSLSSDDAETVVLHGKNDLVGVTSLEKSWLKHSYVWNYSCMHHIFDFDFCYWYFYWALCLIFYILFYFTGSARAPSFSVSIHRPEFDLKKCPKMLLSCDAWFTHDSGRTDKQQCQSWRTFFFWLTCHFQNYWPDSG